MAKANVGGYEFETITRQEMQDDLKQSLGHHFNTAMREWYRGIKPVKLPIITAQATGTSTALPVNEGPMPVICGPQQGYIWKIKRITIASSGTDTGQISLYAGTDPLAVVPQYLVDNTLAVGKAYPANDLLLMPGEQLYAVVTSVANAVYRLSGQAIEVPAEMVAKIL